MLLCLSFDHRTTTFALLERLTRHQHRIAAAGTDPDFARGVALLVTCNRFEVYLDVRTPAPGTALAPHSHDEGAAAERAIARLADAAELDAETLAASVQRYTDRLAAEHLIGVASGLHSAAKGEEEIAGQVRRAHSQAQRAGTMSHALERLFQAATRTSRTVTHRTELRAAGRSLVDLALRMAEGRITEWSDTRVLLIGTGAYAGASVAALRARRVHRISVHSPSGRAAAYGERHGLAPVPPQGLADALRSAQLVLACSRAEEPLLTIDELRAAPAAHPRLLLDLGMPRNIDPGVASAPGVELLDLETITKHASVAELSAEAEALQLVREAASEFASEFAAVQAERDALPTLLTFRSHVLSIMEDELCRARRSNPAEGAAPPTLSEEALRRFTGRLLHEPMTRIRSLARAGRADEATEALNALFGLEAGGPTPAP